MNEVKKHIPLASIIIGLLFSITVLVYRLEPSRSVFYIVLLFTPGMVLTSKKLFNFNLLIDTKNVD